MMDSNGKFQQGRHFWKSLDELHDSEEFREWVSREFPEGASMIEGVERRSFMKVMAASFGLAGMGIAGCRRPEEAIMPYGRSPEEIIPGIPNYYSTSLPGPHGNQPLIVESHQSRPTKVEGNPSYEPSGGATDIYAQASLLDLYDPDRAKASYAKSVEGIGKDESVNWKKLPQSEVFGELDKLVENGKVAILADKSSSPSREMLASLIKDKGFTWAEYEAIDFSSPAIALGKALNSSGAVRAIPKLGEAKRILSIDCDFIGGREPMELPNSRGFAKGRKAHDANDARKMSRLYSVESDLTRTGAAADHRLRLQSSRMVAFANALAALILDLSDDEETLSELKSRGKLNGVNPKWLEEAAKDLVDRKEKGDALVLAGSHLPAEVHVLVYAINQALGANGETIEYVSLPANQSSDLADLVKLLEAGEVETLVFLGGNPVYATSSSMDWEKLTKKVPNKIRFGSRIDETSSLCDRHVGASHYLESWGDGRTWDHSSYVPVQPLVSPLFDTISELDFLARLAGLKKGSHGIVRETFLELSNGASFDDFLRKGILELETEAISGNLDYSSLADYESSASEGSSSSALELLLVPDFHTWDGRYANNGWMQECPDPMSKLTWDNAILVSPSLAKDLEKKHSGLSLLPNPTMLNGAGQIASDNAVFNRGGQDAPVVRIESGDSAFEGPLYVMPGLADNTLIATLGMGRQAAGRVGEGCGYSAYDVLPLNGSRILSGVKVIPTGARRILANVQEHWSMEGRAIVREGTVDEFRKDNSFAAKMGSESHSPPIYGWDKDKDVKFKAQTTPRGNSSYEHPDHTYENSDEFGLHQWAMSIDLNLCSGCNACVVACQSENNIPVVGKDQVLRGREMHWIRLDRYFSSAEDKEPEDLPSDVQVSFQGVACMHCETAPCESVCPVNATVHDEEGLNAMAYNRCVGTRYCANNCPYKVRRFNFFDWNKRAEGEYYKGPFGEKNPTLPSMAKNPDVTVRMRGVMEKCTYCVQRIQEAKIQTKVDAHNRKKLSTGKDGADLEFTRSELKVPDGTIKTACQQVCSADAIVFGDISDTESEVYKLKNNPRDYSVLGYLETRPRTTYLARIRNPNPAMPDTFAQPHSAAEYHHKAHPVHHGHDDKH